MRSMNTKTKTKTKTQDTRYTQLRKVSPSLAIDCECVTDPGRPGRPLNSKYPSFKKLGFPTIPYTKVHSEFDIFAKVQKYCVNMMKMVLIAIIYSVVAGDWRW